MNDNGIALAETQRDITPIQRFVYAMAKDYHTEDIDVDEPQGMKHGHKATRGY